MKLRESSGAKMWYNKRRPIRVHTTDNLYQPRGQQDYEEDDSDDGGAARPGLHGRRTEYADRGRKGGRLAVALGRQDAQRLGGRKRRLQGPADQGMENRERRAHRAADELHQERPLAEAAEGTGGARRRRRPCDQGILQGLRTARRLPPHALRKQRHQVLLRPDPAVRARSIRFSIRATPTPVTARTATAASPRSTT